MTRVLTLFVFFPLWFQQKFEARLVRMLHAEEFDRSLIQRPLADSRPKRLVEAEISALQAQVQSLQANAVRSCNMLCPRAADVVKRMLSG